MIHKLDDIWLITMVLIAAAIGFFIGYRHANNIIKEKSAMYYKCEYKGQEFVMRCSRI